MQITCPKRISYLLAFFSFDFGVLPLFNFCFPPDSMDLVSSSSLAGSSYVKTTKMLLMNKFLDVYGIIRFFSLRNHAKFISKEYSLFAKTKSFSTSNCFTISKVKIQKLTDNIPSLKRATVPFVKGKTVFFNSWFT